MSSRVPYALLCFTIWFAPIPLGANRPWAWGLVEALIALTTLLLLVSHSSSDIIKYARSSFSLLATLLFVQFCVFLQILGASWSLSFLPYSFDVSSSETALLKGLSYCLFVLCFSVLVSTRRRQKQVIRVVMAAGLTQAVYAVFLQYSGLSESFLGYPVSDRARGSFVYHNHLASYLVLCLSLTIGFLVGSLKGFDSGSRRSRLSSMIETMLSEKWIVRVAIIIMVVALILTRSRMGNAVFFLSVFVVTALALFVMRRPANTLKWLVLSLLLMDMFIVGAYFGVEKVKERIELTSFAGETRDDVVAASIPYIEDHWFSGSGAGSFGSVFQAYQPSSFGGYYDYAHNEYIQFLVEFGFFPCLALALFILYAMSRGLRGLMTERSRYRCGLHFALVMALLAIFIHATVDFVFQVMPNVLVLLVIISLSFSNNTLIKKASKKKGHYVSNYN
ncbi:O-antigen ligase family protein [Agaribacterium sp. ZY112]|uniref:O-antigen ligase family protein n=1 Tax=Agaribacterium sp. ZY112 TaxID=3233574 RepID=UPI003524E628